MDTIQSVGIREFRQNLHKYTGMSNNPIAITSHGERVGFYIPARPSPQKKDFEALQNAAAKISQLLEKSAISEEDIVAEFDSLRAADRQQPK